VKASPLSSSPNSSEVFTQGFAFGQRDRGQIKAQGLRGRWRPPNLHAWKRSSPAVRIPNLIMFLGQTKTVSASAAARAGGLEQIQTRRPPEFLKERSKTHKDGNTSSILGDRGPLLSARGGRKKDHKLWNGAIADALEILELAGFADRGAPAHSRGRNIVSCRWIWGGKREDWVKGALVMVWEKFGFLAFS